MLVRFKSGIFRNFGALKTHDAKYPLISATSFGSNDSQTSSTWVFDASYHPLKKCHFRLYVSQGNASSTKAFFDDVRIYVSGQNLLTFDRLARGY
jgi:hypothetical protein